MQNQKTTHWEQALVAAMLLSFFLLSVSFSESFEIGPNYRNISVDTTVNISNAKPEVLQVLIDGGVSNITLEAGNATTITCNVSVRDYNGGGTIANVTATFYDNTTSSHGDVDDNNTHYTNSSCAQNNVNGFDANYTCTFPVQYYANSGSWTCNATATDSFDFNGSDSASLDNFTNLDALFALNVTTLIDYGDLAVEDTSTPQSANITNFGNEDINVSVYGYGATPGDGYAMVCDVGTIGIANEKYSLVDTADFDTGYTSLSGTASQIANLTIGQQTNDVVPSENETFWRLYVPPNPFGICNGTIVFQAEQS